MCDPAKLLPGVTSFQSDTKCYTYQREGAPRIWGTGACVVVYDAM
jgi:hypothetical protein